MRTLYPPCDPRVAEHLDVGDGHQIYVERAGSPSGIPVVFLHGGPGSGCKPEHRQFFDPQQYNIVLIDQRGSGRSTPLGGAAANSTDHLICDLEHVREHCGIQRWLLFGGSWGAALALAYAEEFPERVLGMVLRGIFLARQCDIDWFFTDGANRLLPQQWQTFSEAVGRPRGQAMIDHLHDDVFSSDPVLVERTARAWEAWSGAVVTFSLAHIGSGQSELKAAIAKTRIEMHYAKNRYFMGENQLLARAHRLPSVPVTIVHGARDLTCPAQSAWAVHAAIARSKLEILRTAGHLSGETPMIDALVRAADAMVEEVGVWR